MHKQKRKTMSHTLNSVRRHRFCFFILLLVLVWTLRSAQSTAGQAWPPREMTRDAPPTDVKILNVTLHPNGLQSTRIQIPAAGDSYIASERPEHNFGDDALFLGYNLDGDHYGAERVLLYFDVLSAIPPGAIIEDAHLQLHVSYANPAEDAPMGTVLRRIASEWEESTVTWETEPRWGEIRASADVSMTNTDCDWDIKGLVSDWVDGTRPNYGMEIIGDERVQQRERAFFARESTSGTTPHLIVEYTTTNDTWPPEVTVVDLPDYSPRHFEVTWQGSDEGGAGIATYDVQYRIDEGAWADWITQVTYTYAVYTGEEGRLYEFRARGIDRTGNIEAYGPVEAGTTVDSTPPTTSIDPLAGIMKTKLFTVSWSGEDAVSGIHYYDARYRYNNDDWLPWQQETLTTEAIFSAVEDGVYAFEVRAVDWRGLVEPFRALAEVTTIVDTEAPFVIPRVWLPCIRR